MKKLKKWQIVLIVIGILVVIGTIIDRVEYYKDPKAYTESSIARAESESRESAEKAESRAVRESEIAESKALKEYERNLPIYTINSQELDRSGVWVTLRGTLTANKDRSLVVIKAEFYDKNGVVVGQANDVISNMEKGKTYKYEIFSTCESSEVASYKLLEP